MFFNKVLDESEFKEFVEKVKSRKDFEQLYWVNK